MKNKLKVLILLVCLCLVFKEIKCGRGGGGRISGGSRGWGGGSRTSSSSSSGGGWFSWGSSSKSSSSSTQSKPVSTSGWKKPATTSHVSSNPSNVQTGSYGWKKQDSSIQTGFNRPSSGQTTGNSGWTSSVTGTRIGPNSGISTGTGTASNYGWKAPATNTKPNAPPPYTPHDTKPISNPSGTSYGWKKPADTNPKPPPYTPHNPSKPPAYTPNNPSKPPAYTPHDTSKFQHQAPPPKYSAVDPHKPPSSNIGPGGYPVQSGVNNYKPNTGSYNTGYNPSGGYNTGYRPSGGYNTGYRPHGGYGYSDDARRTGYYPSQYGYSSNVYPSQNTFGYPGQGMFGGSQSPRYNGMGIFGGSTGHYGYPSSGSWGYPSYGSGGFGQSSGSGSLMKGLAIGAVGGYLTSSLIHKVSNPWGYGGHGYGNDYGYYRDYGYRNPSWRSYQSTTPPPPPPNPEDKWIHCVAVDPKTKETLINPNCSCTVTTVMDPVTNQPISTHNCTTSNGQIIPQNFQPVPLTYGQSGATGTPPLWNPGYNGTTNYAQGYNYQPPLVIPDNSTSQPVSETFIRNESAGVITEAFIQNKTAGEVTETLIQNKTGISEAQSQTDVKEVDEKRKEVYTQLEKLVNMGRFDQN